jgi:hypothetical protein
MPPQSPSRRLQKRDGRWGNLALEQLDPGGDRAPCYLPNLGIQLLFYSMTYSMNITS